MALFHLEDMEVRFEMHYGATLFITDYSIQPAELAVELEARGFESVWLPEHSHIPVERRSPWPGGAELPKMYYDVYEPFASLAAAAAVTSTLRVATGICLVVQRDPIQTAKDVATLDRISNGRAMFGVGAGWNAEEMANHGTRDFRSRFKLMRERIEAMKEIWTRDEARYNGEFVNFEPVFAWPKPVQKPHPPIHVGGGFPGAARRAARYGDGWMPIFGRDPIEERLADFRQLAEEAGRDPAQLEISVFAAPPDPDRLARLRDAGAARVVFGLPPAGRDQVLPLLDRHVEIMKALG